MSNPRILILFYSMYGHIYELTKSIVEGIEEAQGEPIIKKVAELVPDQYLDDYAKKFKESIKDIKEGNPREDFEGIDGIIIGTPTRFGNMCAQMKNYLDQTSSFWLKGTLVGKPASVFTSSATQHGGQESTILSTMIPLLHQGCVLVGLPYSFQEQMRIDEITGSSPYGVSTITGGKGERFPSENEKKLAKDLGKYLTNIARKLKDN
ncbi:MAG: NAD(P)H:quinone oxidoreductase, type IV [Spirochaetes bacterium GWD1_27_9]|nr:MAG: NAD(P)H:quinone oxidoreductase, type IV [Spirochaetes bacterium GWD1_27_9]